MPITKALKTKGETMTRASNQNRIGTIEILESKKLMTADMGLDLVDAPTETAIVADSFTFGVEREMKESGEKGGTADMNIGIGELQECTVSKSMDQAADDDGSQFFVADSFSFSVEREMKESGEKGGTEDINIGIGELQECTVSKSMDSASAKLAQFAINGNSCGVAEIDFVEVGGGGAEGTAEIEFVEVGGGDLESETVDEVMASMSSSGDADDRPTEEVAFYYNR